MAGLILTIIHPVQLFCHENYVQYHIPNMHYGMCTMLLNSALCQCNSLGQFNPLCSFHGSLLEVQPHPFASSGSLSWIQLNQLFLQHHNSWESQRQFRISTVNKDNWIIVQYPIKRCSVLKYTDAQSEFSVNKDNWVLCFVPLKDVQF